MARKGKKKTSVLIVYFGFGDANMRRGDAKNGVTFSILSLTGENHLKIIEKVQKKHNHFVVSGKGQANSKKTKNKKTGKEEREKIPKIFKKKSKNVPKKSKKKFGGSPPH